MKTWIHMLVLMYWCTLPLCTNMHGKVPLYSTCIHYCWTMSPRRWLTFTWNVNKLFLCDNKKSQLRRFFDIDLVGKYIRCKENLVTLFPFMTYDKIRLFWSGSSSWPNCDCMMYYSMSSLLVGQYFQDVYN